MEALRSSVYQFNPGNKMNVSFFQTIYDKSMQNVIVAFMVFLLITSAPVCIFLFAYFLFFTKLWSLALLYFFWMIYDIRTPRRGGRTCRFFGQLSFLWRHYKNYFPIEIIKTEELRADKNYIFGCHPHGLACLVSIGCLTTECCNIGKLFPGLKVFYVTLFAQFCIPFRREIFLWLGFIDRSKMSIFHVLNPKQTGSIVAITIGGVEESLYSDDRKIQILLRNRKGFVKIALQTGSNLVPTMSFGENRLYTLVKSEPGSCFMKFQDMVYRNFGFVLKKFYGRRLFGFIPLMFLPYRQPTHFVVGKAIDVPQIENPTIEQIDFFHKKYVEQIQKLFDEYKTKYCADCDLEIL